MIDIKEIIRDLIFLTGRTITSTALEAGIDPTNLSRFLKGHATVSEQKMEKVLELLGIEFPATLSPNRVHLWTLKTGDLLPLSRLLSWTNQNPFEMAYLMFSPRKLKSYLTFRSFMNNPLLIRSCSSSFPIKIVFRRRPPVLLPESKFEKEDHVLVHMGLAKWRNIPKKYLYPLIEVDNSTYEKFSTGKDLSVQEFEQVWNSISEKSESFIAEPEEIYGWTWERLVSSLKEQGETPEEVAKKLGL